MTINEIKNILNKDFKDYKILHFINYENQYYVFLEKEDVFGVPILVFNKNNNDKKAVARNSKEGIEIQKKLLHLLDFDPDQEDDYD